MQSMPNRVALWKMNRKKYVEKINKIDSSVFNERDFKNWKSVRKEFDARMKKYGW